MEHNADIKYIKADRQWSRHLRIAHAKSQIQRSSNEADRMTITIERPKDIDLEEFFELKVWIAVTLDNEVVLPRKQIAVGQRSVLWEIKENISVNGVIIYMKDKQVPETLGAGTTRLAIGDTLTVMMRWETFDT